MRLIGVAQKTFQWIMMIESHSVLVIPEILTHLETLFLFKAIFIRNHIIDIQYNTSN